MFGPVCCGERVPRVGHNARGESYAKAAVRKTQRRRRNDRGFGLIEILFYVGIIGLLALGAIASFTPLFNTGRYGAIKQTMNDLEAAAHAYVLKVNGLGTLPITEGAIPSSQFTGTGTTSANVAAAATIDQMLLAEGFLKKPVTINIPTATYTPTGSVGVTWNTSTSQWTATAAPTLDYSNVPRAETITSNQHSTPDLAFGKNWNLSGDGVTFTTPNKTILFLEIPNCPANTAWEISRDIDGPALTQADSTTADAKGVVVYPTPTGATTTVSIYIMEM